MSGITVLIHTRNSEKTLERLLQSVSWADSLIAVDMSSTDQTVSILENAGAAIHHLDEQPWSDALRNSFLDLPKTAWTLVVDSDEYLSDDAEELCRGLIESADDQITAFCLPRFNWCFGRVLEGQRWYPDWQIRLFRTNSITYHTSHHTPPTPRESGKQVSFPELANAPHLHHDHYNTMLEFVERQIQYALADHYPGETDWSQYSITAIERVLASQFAPSPEETAMEIALAWDSIIRALIHWEENGRVEPIPQFFGWAFGVYDGPGRTATPTSREAADLAHRLDQVDAELRGVKNTLSWKITKPLRLVGLFAKNLRPQRPETP